MKLIIPILLISLISSTIYGQNKVGIDNSSPDQKLSINGKIEIGDDGNPATSSSIKWDGYNFMVMTV